MKGRNNKSVDPWLIVIWLLLLIAGWFNIYSSAFNEEHPFFFDLSQRYGMQLIWIMCSVIIAVLIVYIINPKIYSVFSPPLYALMIIVLLAVIFLGKEVNGSKSWLMIGPFSLQPAEFSKITTALLLSYVMSRPTFSLSTLRGSCIAASIVLFPMLLILMEKETGSAVVYLSLILLFYLEGFSGWVLFFGVMIITLFILTLVATPGAAIICTLLVAGGVKSYADGSLRPLLISLLIAGICYFYTPLAEIRFLHFLHYLKPESCGLILTGIWVLSWLKKAIKKGEYNTRFLIISVVVALAVIFSTNFLFDNVLQPHQRVRIENQLGIVHDIKGVGYNVHQSKIAIGSGGLFGKGYLNGTQTKYNFVPEQTTDFIFCTIGEEWGFVGCLVIILLYTILIIRLILLASKNKDPFARLYGYCVACLLLAHVFINIGMTIGLVPVIGIPLPFLSYGGSGMLSFTILLFIFIRLDTRRINYY